MRIAPGIGLVVDGFPRSALQVECVMALFNKLKVMHDTFMDTDEKGCCRFPRPSFKVSAHCLLWEHPEHKVE